MDTALDKIMEARKYNGVASNFAKGESETPVARSEEHKKARSGLFPALGDAEKWHVRFLSLDACRLGGAKPSSRLFCAMPALLEPKGGRTRGNVPLAARKLFAQAGHVALQEVRVA